MILAVKMVEFGVILPGRMMNSGMILTGKVKEEAEFGMNLRVSLKKKSSQ
jgi:hypothetical protein